MPRNSVQSVGNSTYSFTHPLINNGVAINLSGIKLEAQYFKARQMVDNSKVVLLVDGIGHHTDEHRARRIIHDNRSSRRECGHGWRHRSDCSPAAAFG